MLMWSEIAISDPGPFSGRSDPAAFVAKSASAPARRSERTAAAMPVGGPPS